MKILLTIFLAFVVSCSDEKIPQSVVESQISTETLQTPKINDEVSKSPNNIERKIERYFGKHEIKPSVIIENDYDGAPEEIEEIKVSNHKITWFHSSEELKLKIDDDLITLKDKESINNAHDSGKINGKIVNQWRKIKLFSVNKRELIAIEMGQDFCTGLMCSVTFFLVYDLNTKTPNFFGDFRIDNELKLYSFGNDGAINFLGTTNVGFTYTSGFEFNHIYELYTLNTKGVFIRQADNNQKPFYIKRTFKTLEVRSKDDEDYKELDNKFEQNWIEEIK